MGYNEFIEFIKNFEPVAAGTPNRPLRQLDENIRFLRDVIEAAEIGSTVFARDQTVEPDTPVGTPVYFNASSQRFERGLAAVETDLDSGQLVTAASSHVWGIVYTKMNSTLADILLFGHAELDISAAVDEAVTAGIYYLSGTTPGKLVRQRPPVSVPILRTDDDGKVFVNVQWEDFLNDHVHFKFDLVAAPAGEHTPPAEADPHTITSPDSSLPGWLPADDAIFGGKAPEGAVFGYNLSADASLASAWPPLPTDSSVLQMLKESVFTDLHGLHTDAVLDFPSIGSQSFEELTVPLEGARLIDTVVVSVQGGPTADGVIQAWVSADDVVTVRYTNPTGGPIDPAATTYHLQLVKDEVSNGPSTDLRGFQGVPSDLVVMDRNGIWWMTDCYNQVPWPTSLNTAESESVSEPAVDCPVESEMQIRLWFTQMTFLTDNAAVTSLTSDDPRIEVLCETDPTKPGRTGALLLRLALEFLIDEADDERGFLVFKTFDPETNTFKRGPVAEGLYALTNNITLTSPLTTKLDPEDENSADVHHGPIGIEVDTQGDRELPLQIVRLDGVTEEFFRETPYLGYQDDEANEARFKFDIPSTLQVATPKLRIRLRILGRAAGTLPELTLTGRRIPRPEPGPLDLPAVDTDIVIDTTGIIDANQYIEAESDQIDVEAGDIFLFTVSRADDDAYTGEVGILQAS
jgi:hypothetical protein